MSDYKNTLNLPETGFPMKANLTQREPQRLKQWEEMGLYDKVYEHLTLDAPSPDLVIYLQAPVDGLLERIIKRGNPDEKFLRWFTYGKSACG